MAIDRRGKLVSDAFGYVVTKSGAVRVSRGGRVVSVIAGAAGAKLSAKLAKASDERAQLLLAKATGHYKHGNER